MYTQQILAPKRGEQLTEQTRQTGRQAGTAQVHQKSVSIEDSVHHALPNRMAQLYN